MATEQPLVSDLLHFFVGYTNIYFCSTFVPFHLPGVPIFGQGTLSLILTLFIAQNTVEFAIFSEILIKSLLLRLSCIWFALVAFTSSHLTLH